MRRVTLQLIPFIAFAACSDSLPTAPASDSHAPEPAGAHLVSAIDPCPTRRAPLLGEVVIPDSEYRTLQAGVCAVRDGGVVHVLPGVYEERITIRGKRVEIRGVGSDEESTQWPEVRAAVPMEVVAARAAEGVITISEGGSLNLRMLRITGGDAGILVGETAGLIDVKHAIFEDNGRGILHFSAAALSVKHVTFTGQLWNAISFAPFDLTAQNCGGLQVSHGVFGSTGNAGIYVRGCFHTIDHTSISFAQGGGIVAIASVVTIDNVNIAFARYFGILLVNTAAQIEDTAIDFTKAGPLAPNPNPVYGDAISMWSTNLSWAQGGPKPSFAFLKNNTTTFTERVAFSVFGGHGDLKGNTFSNQAIDIQVETFDGFITTMTDLGGNQCFPSIGPGNPCIAMSSVLQPIPPVGGLE